MIILTDCLTEKVDEGALKVANSLTKRIKEKYSNTKIVSYGKRKSKLSDVHLSLNKFFLNKSLIKMINDENDELLYIPFSSNTKASIIRTFVLSLFTKKNLKVLFVLKHPMNSFFAYLLKVSKSKIYVLSKESQEYFESFGINNVNYIKTGVDVHKFIPVSNEEKRTLRDKYQIDQNEKIILHVGHLHQGRNIETLMLFKELAKPVLVVSSVSKQDDLLRKKIENNGIKTIDYYIPNIEELYQLSDIYFFPVMEIENCIDVPLSVLEAAACNLPIVTTQYGELKSFVNEDGFIFIESFDKEKLSTNFKSIEHGYVE